MILTVTLNATLHVTYEAERISWGEPNMVSQMSCRAGAGGLAVSRLLAALGEDVLAAGFAGGGAADLIESDLGRSGVATAFTRISRESRRVIEVVEADGERRTQLSEPAPFITTEELGRLAAEFRKLVPGAAAVVLSGGLSAGLPLDLYASLTSYAAEAGVPAIVHASGPVLWRSLARHPALALPAVPASDADLPGADLTPARIPNGTPARTPDGSPAGLVGRGALAAARVAGPAVLAAAGGQDWRAALEGIPGLVLSGEAVVAGLLPAAVQGWAWPDALRHAVALGAASELSGEIDLDAYEMLSSDVAVELVR